MGRKIRLTKNQRGENSETDGHGILQADGRERFAEERVLGRESVGGVAQWGLIHKIDYINIRLFICFGS